VASTPIEISSSRLLLTSWKLRNEMTRLRKVLTLEVVIPLV
jgi:hypothetical protein